MKEKCDPETIIKTLKEKGYDDHFVVQVCHFGKLDDSLGAFFKDYHSDEGILNGMILLTCYLQSNGPDKPQIKSDMCGSYKMGQFSIDRMVITYEDRFRRELENCILNVTLQSIPTANEAVKMMVDRLNKKIPTEQKGFRL